MGQNTYSIEKIQSASRLRETRENAGLTQEKFAEVLGISLPGYKKVEKGENSVSLASLRKLHDKMKVSSDYILYGTSESMEDIWTGILNCTEQDKMQLFLRLYQYFTQDKTASYPVADENGKYDHIIIKILQKIQEEGEG